MQERKLNPIVALAAVVGVFALAACNTVEGAGKDVEAAGGAVAEGARDTKDEINKK